MRKLLLVSIGLCAFSVMFAGTNSSVSNDGVNKRSELIKLGADGRFTVTPDMITGIQDVKDRINAPSKSKEMITKLEAEKAKAKANVRQNDVKQRDDAQISKKQSIQTEMENARVTKKPRRAPAGSSFKHRNQWGEPFYANGDDMALSHIDMMFSLKSSAFQNIGNRVYTYDADGNVISSEYTITNVNGIVNEVGSWGIKIPNNATIKMVSFESDTLVENATYYIDPLTGARHDISLYRVVYYNDEPVSMIQKELDKNGNMVEYAKMESEFDSQGRPVVTTRYSQYTITDNSTGTVTYKLRPSRKIEYEYRPDGLVTKTESYAVVGASVEDSHWVYSSRTTNGTDDEGVYYNEYLYFSTSDSAWYGSDKYTRLEKETADGGSESFYTYWKWDRTNKEWKLSNKQYRRYNSKGNVTLSETYEYSIPLQTYYPSSVYGYEYVGDTARCGDWTIYYNSPDSIQQLDDQMSLVSYGYRNEYAFYTPEELGWPEDVLNDNSLPRKYDIRYSLDKKNKQSVKWIEESKQEYGYDLVTVIGSEGKRVFKTSQKEYYWENDDWAINDEYRYAYNDHGDDIMTEYYRKGQIVSREVKEYAYYHRVYSGDSILERKVISEKYWNSYNGELVPSSIYEYGYDEDYQNQIFYSYCESWDATNNCWMRGYKSVSKYDESNNESLSEYYHWSSDRGIWIGNSKETYKYNENGEVLRREYWNNISDTSTVWNPGSLDIVQYDDNGNMVLNEYCEYWTGESWDYGSKSEWSYSDQNQLLSETEYYLASGQWHGNHKAEYEYNDKGQIILSQSYSYDFEGSAWLPSMKDVFSYTDAGEPLNSYSYNYDGSDWQLTEKKLAIIEGGVITAYADSIYDSWTDAWSPSSYITVTRDETTGIVTALYQDWDSYNEVWENDKMESQKYDSEGRITYTESFYWVQSYDYSSGSYVYRWRGDNKAEYGYNDKGSVVMTATYYWSNYDTVWVGNNKSESDYDEYGNQILYGYYYWDYEKHEWYGNYRSEYAYDSKGNQTLSISYNWDYDQGDWVGEYKSEFGYNEEGERIMSAYYYGTDSEGEWIGDSKYVYYTKDDVSYSENYDWDYDRKDWYGESKSEYCYNDNQYVYAKYTWDYNDWCWVGEEKTVENYLDNGEEDITYSWDLTTSTWVAASKRIEEMTQTASSNKYVYTDAVWNALTSDWLLTRRETNEEVYRSDDNLDYELIAIETYNSQTSSWSQLFTIKQVYVYKSLTGVEDIRIDQNIRIEDGLIIVDADNDTAISISAVSGAPVASGKGSVEASVAPGIYLISVGDKTVKIIVR